MPWIIRATRQDPPPSPGRRPDLSLKTPGIAEDFPAIGFPGSASGEGKADMLLTASQ